MHVVHTGKCVAARVHLHTQKPNTARLMPSAITLHLTAPRYDLLMNEKLTTCLLPISPTICGHLGCVRVYALMLGAQAQGARLAFYVR